MLEEYERIEQNEKKFAKEREALIKSLAFQDISTTVVMSIKLILLICSVSMYIHTNYLSFPYPMYTFMHVYSNVV